MPNKTFIHLFIYNDPWEFMVTDRVPSPEDSDMYTETMLDIDEWKAFQAAEAVYLKGKRAFIELLPVIGS